MHASAEAQRVRVAMTLEGVSGRVGVNVAGAALATDSTGLVWRVDIPATAQDIASDRCRTIIGITSAEAASICVATHVQGRTHALLSVRVPPIAPAPATIALKIVLDMSHAVHIGAYVSYVAEILGTLKSLRAGDQFSITLLRDDPSQPLAKMRSATDRALAEAEAVLLQRPRASELPSSLDDVFIEALDIASEADHVSVVLITASPFLDRARVMHEAVDAEESIFPVVCGRQPNVTFMRELAEATGGACEWALGTLGLHRELNRQLLRATGARQRHFAATCPTIVQEVRGHPPCGQDSLPWTFAGETLHKFLVMDGDVDGEVRVAHPKTGQSEPLIPIDLAQPHTPQDLWKAPVPSLVEHVPIQKAHMPDMPAIAEAWLALRSLDEDGHALFERAPLSDRTDLPPLTPVLSVSPSGE